MNQLATSAVFRCYRTRRHYSGRHHHFRRMSKKVGKRENRMSMNCNRHCMQGRLLDRSLCDGRVLVLCI